MLFIPSYNKKPKDIYLKYHKEKGKAENLCKEEGETKECLAF